MCDVRKSMMRWVAMGLGAGLLASALGARAYGQIQVDTGLKPAKPRQQHRARRETNASRQARIQRTLQDTYSHRWEIFGGGGFLRFRSGEYTQRNNEVSWAAGANYFLNQKLAIVGDARGSFGNAKVQHTNGYSYPQAIHPQINEYTFMGGADYRFLRHEKTTLSVQALGGVGWGIFSGGSKGIPSVDLGLWPDGFRPAFSLGVSADYNLYPNLALRLTPTYVGTTFGGNVQNNLGFNAGIVYRFGRQK